MLERVVRINLRYIMFARGHRIGVAVSGGADSVCLLEILRELAPAWDLHLEVLHLNHMLRGQESDADEEFVRNLASRHALPFHLERVDIRQLAAGKNIEEAAREARLAFFLRVKQQASLGCIATGHTRDDQAETVLFRILRGAGSSGLCGILPVTSEGLIRPLLDLERRETEEWLRRRGIEWRHDSTNDDQSLTRNRIRHSTLPLLEREFNPEIRAALARLAATSFDEETYWTETIGRLWAPLTEAAGIVELDTEALAAAPPAVGRRLIRRALGRIRGSLQGLGFEHVEQALDLARQHAGSGRLDLPGASICRSFNRLRFEAGRILRTNSPWEFTLSASGDWPIPSGGVIRLIVSGDAPALEGRSQCRYNENRHWLDREKVYFPLTLRNWRPGDTFQPPGREHPVKMKGLFQRARVPAWERRNWPVILSEGRVAWSRRFGSAGWAAPPEGARRLVEIVDLNKEDSAESAQEGH